MTRKIPNLLSMAADMLLPDSCAVCGASLVLDRPLGVESLPLCSGCFSGIVQSVRNIRYPNLRKCIKCGYPLISELSFCGRCREREWHFDSADSLFFYTGKVKALIGAYKFDNRKKLAGLFAELIQREIPDNFRDYTIVPVPFRPSSKRRRGWDQVEAIVSILERNYSFKVSRCLKRREGRAQKTMDYEHRLLNLKNKIIVKSGINVPSEILLIDDVFTTGATMDFCAEVLAEAGAVKISCYSLAIDL